MGDFQNYYKFIYFLQQCAQNKKEVQWLWSKPNSFIRKKLLKNFCPIDKNISSDQANLLVNRFIQNFSNIKKTKKNLDKRSNDVKITPLAIIYYLNEKKFEKDICKKTIGNFYEPKKNNQPAKIYIKLSANDKNNYHQYINTERHELYHALFYLSQSHKINLDKQLTNFWRKYHYNKKLLKFNRQIAQQAIDRMDEIFRDELIAYNCEKRDVLHVVRDYEISDFCYEKVLYYIYKFLYVNKKIKNRKKYFYLYYNQFGDFLKLQPLYLYLTEQYFQDFKKNYSNSYQKYFFNTFAPLSIKDFILTQSKRSINKYYDQQKKFIVSFNKKIECVEKMNIRKRKSAYIKYFNFDTVNNLYLFNSSKLLKKLLLFLTYLDQDFNPVLVSDILNLTAHAYHVNSPEIRKEAKPLLVKLLKIKRRYLPLEFKTDKDFFESIVEFLKISYI